MSKISKEPNPGQRSEAGETREFTESSGTSKHVEIYVSQESRFMRRMRERAEKKKK
jgi:hypothetical protein